jgi:hypothetical protein
MVSRELAVSVSLLHTNVCLRPEFPWFSSGDADRQGSSDRREKEYFLVFS